MTKSKANSSNLIQAYRIREIPDWSCWQNQIIAGGDVCSAIFAGWESFTRQISHMEPGSVSATDIEKYQDNTGRQPNV